MFRKHSRIIASIALGFFTWTSGGLFSIANAAQLEVNKSKAQAGQQQKKTKSPEERFSKITEDLENALADTKADADHAGLSDPGTELPHPEPPPRHGR